MKIFGNASVQGRISADTGSFKIYGITAGEQTPNVFIAGTDSPDIKSTAKNRSIVAHGQYDYVVASQNGGSSFDQSILQAGSVMGYRVQHVRTAAGENKIYILRTVSSGNIANPASSINVSLDGGLSFISNTANGAYTFPAKIVAFDMLWLNEDEAFVVGGTPGTTPDNSLTGGIAWKKFIKYGLQVVSGNGNKAEQYPIIFKKQPGSDTFVEWGTAPSDVAEDCATAIAVSPTNSSIVILGTQQGKLYKSTDGALTWTRVGSIGPTGTCVNRIKFVTGDSTKIYAVGTDAALYRSDSTGDSWYSLNSNSTPIVDANGNNLVILTRDGRIPAFNDILVPNTNDIIVVGDDHTRILKSSNGGTTWKYVSSGIYSDYLPIENVKSIRVGLANYYVGISRNKLFVALNADIVGIDKPNQIDWIEYDLGDDAIDLQLVADDNPSTSDKAGYAFILTKTGIYEFSLSTGQLTALQDFTSVVSDTPTKLTVHSYREIYITTANAKIIRGTKYNPEVEKTFSFVEETSSLSSQDLVTISTAKSGRIFAGSNGGKIIFKETGSIVNETTYSTDPVTWTETTATPTASIHSVLQIQALDNLNIYALIEDTGSLQNVLFNSTDSGSTWNRLYTYPEGIKKVIVYNTASIYAINQFGNKFYYTTSSFAEITTTTIDNTTASYADVFELDTARSLTQDSIVFLLGGSFGIRATNAKLLYPLMGPWTDNSWTLCAIAGESGYNYWVGGGTTFNATRGSKDNPYNLGSEPILLVSSNGGESWENAITRLSEQEPPDTGNSGGDFTFTSISEGQYFIQEDKDVFNIYNSNDNGSTFTKTDSNLYREDLKYPGNLDGIRKIRFFDSKFGVAVGDVNQMQLQNGSKISITTDGGATWNFVESADLEQFNFNSVFVTRQLDDGEYELYVTAYPKDLSLDGYIFRSKTSGRIFSTAYRFTDSATTGLAYQPQDIYFSNPLTGSVTIKGAINGTPSVEGIYRTTDGGLTWNLVTITDFAAGETRGHLQFITARKGFVAGTYGSNKNAGLFKTTDAGASWTRIVTPYDSTPNKTVTGLYFLTEAVGVISMGSEIWKTTDSGSNWSKVHDLAYTGVVNEIKFSANGQLGYAVGHYGATNSTSGEHFILKSENSGSTWTLIDSKHDYIDLEFEFDSSRNLIGQPSTLYTIAFAEKIILSEETRSVEDGGGDPADPKPIGDCFGTQFMSASYYNFENFAYRCTPSGSNPKYYPNSSNNIGLGKGIFGQNSSVELSKLRNKLTYGAALGVGALGKAEYSRADTAAGFGAMDMIRNAKNNVAIGYKALSSNIADNGTTLKNTALNIFATSSIFGIVDNGELVISNDAGDTWTTQKITLNTGSYNTGSYSGSLNSNKIYKASATEVFVLSNDSSGSAPTKTLISKYNKVNDKYNAVYSSSLYYVDNLSVINSSILFGLDNTNGVFLRSINGGYSFRTGSVQNTAGNTLKSFKMYSQNFGFIVGSKIWNLTSGSNTVWETSSYSGSHILNAIDYVNANTWVAVGTSGSVYRTTNKGLNWNFISTGLTNNNLLDVQAAGSKIVAVGESGSIIVSSNGGITWKSGSFSVSGSQYESITEVDLIDNNTILARHTNGLLKSVDGGKTWFDSSNNIDVFASLIANTTVSNNFSIKSIASTRYSNDTPGINPNYDLSLKNALTENPITQQTIPLEIVDENVAVGSYALSAFENSSRMVAIGANALKTVETNTGVKSLDSIYEDVFKAIYFGDLIFGPEDLNAPQPKLASNYGQIAIGAYSQHKSINSTFNTSVGYGSMYNTVNSSNNTAVGFYSQHLGQNHRNTSLGVWALGFNGDLTEFAPTASVSLKGGNDNIAVGYKSLLNNLGSVRAAQISQSGYPDPYRIFPNFGSRNIAIGNYAFLNASGSADTIAIGYRAVSDTGFDLTDSVFIGNYVGQNFKTKLGTYYSSSQNNDWKFTQTVAVGSRTLQNHTGYDIVAVGANALRGTQSGSNAATPDVTISSDPVGVLAIGFFNSHILTRNDFADFSSRKWSVSNYVKKRGDSYFIYDELTNVGKKWNPRYTKSKPVSIAIASRQTAYAAIEQTLANGTKYPLIVRTNNLSGTNGKDGIEWNVIQPGLLRNLGAIQNTKGVARSLKLNAPDENTLYLSVAGLQTSAGAPFGAAPFKSIVYKATSLNNFTSPNALDFTAVLDSSAVGVPPNAMFSDMHFPNASTGIVIGGGRNYITTDGGSNWTDQTIDASVSGSDVTFNAVWMNQAGTVAYAVGTYGSIHKWTSANGFFTKQLGSSLQTRFGGTFWDTVFIDGVAVPAYFATRPNNLQKNISFVDVDFLNDSFGIAVGIQPTSFTSPSAPFPVSPSGYNMIVAKTSNGGNTWQHVAVTLPEQCGGARAINGATQPQPFGEITIIDENKAIIGMSYGQIAYTTDGGATWDFTDSHYGASFSTNQACGCDPFPVTWCSDYKFFEGSTVTVPGQYQDVVQVVAVGSEAQPKLTAVNNNVAVGYKVQFDGTGSATDSVQIGARATISGNSINDTVAIGKDSLYVAKYSDKNTAVGKNTLDNLVQNDAAQRAFPGPVVGDFEFTAQTDSSNNTVVGYKAGSSLVAGDKNVFVGVNSGMLLNAPFVKTWGSNNIIIGANAAKTQHNMMNQVAIGNQQIESHIAWGAPGVAGWIWQSDARDKADTGSFTLGLDFVRQIQPKEFKWDGRFNYASGSPDGTYKHSGSSYGYIAQDLEAAANAVGVSSSLFILGASGSYSGSVSETGSFDIKLIKPAMVNLVAINAIKQLDTTVTYLSSSKYTSNLGDGSNLSYGVTHSLGTRDVIAMVYSNNSNLVVYPTMSINSTNTMTIVFNTIPSTNEYRLVVMR